MRKLWYFLIGLILFTGCVSRRSIRLTANGQKEWIGNGGNVKISIDNTEFIEGEDIFLFPFIIKTPYVFEFTIYIKSNLQITDVLLQSFEIKITEMNIKYNDDSFMQPFYMHEQNEDGKIWGLKYVTIPLENIFSSTTPKISWSKFYEGMNKVEYILLEAAIQYKIDNEVYNEIIQWRYKPKQEREIPSLLTQ